MQKQGGGGQGTVGTFALSKSAAPNSPSDLCILQPYTLTTSIFFSASSKKKIHFLESRPLSTHLFNIHVMKWDIS
ncbi:hypothetical protein H8957_012828 [Semnopithecus entellus]